jgi:hypothetical protein
MHVLTCINNLNGIIKELKEHNIKINCIDDLFNNNKMGFYTLSVNQAFTSDLM